METPPEPPLSPPPLPPPWRRPLLFASALVLAVLFFVSPSNRFGRPWPSLFSGSGDSAAGTFLWLLPGSALLLIWAVRTNRQVSALGAITGLLHLALLVSPLALAGPWTIAVGLFSLAALLASTTPAAPDVELLLGGLRRQPSEVIRHWYAYVEDFSTSPKEFYAAIEAEIVRRDLPKVELTYLNRSEGSRLASPLRLYLRLRLADTLFDLCAAPFGTGYFFSFRVSALPFRFSLLDYAIAGLGLYFGGVFLLDVFGFILGSVLLGSSVVALALALWRSPRFAAGGLDDVLLSLRVIGPLYYHFFRAQTVYRQDATLVYLQAVERIFRRQVDELTLAHGVKLSRTFDYDQVLGGAYEERPKRLALDLVNPLRVVNDAEHP